MSEIVSFGDPKESARVFDDQKMHAVGAVLRRAAPQGSRSLQHAVTSVVTAGSSAGAVTAASNIRRQPFFHSVASNANAPVSTTTSARGFATESQSMENPEFLILDNALNHVAEHGYVCYFVSDRICFSSVCFACVH